MMHATEDLTLLMPPFIGYVFRSSDWFRSTTPEPQHVLSEHAPRLHDRISQCRWH